MARHGISRRLIAGSVLLCMGIGLVVSLTIFVPPQTPGASLAFGLGLGISGMSLGILFFRHIRRSVLAGIFICGLVLLRFYHLDTVINLILLGSVVAVIEYYFWE